ncbi:MAG: FkbM family methyltransferase, partial [Acidimicrobiia bacterium]|nr:FkbM family methyltransferase [Acidimicrobiia bacterium]
GWRWPANPLPQLFDAAYVVTGLVAAVALATAYSNGLVVHLSEALAIGRTSTIARIVATGGVAWLITTVIALYAGAGAFSFPLAMSAYALVARLLFRPVLKPVLRPHARTRARRTNEASGSEGAAAADPISLAEQDAAVAALRQRLGPLATMGLRPVPTRILARIATQGDTLAASLARGGLSGRAAIDLDGPAAGMAFVAGARIRPDERRVSALDRALEEYVQPGQVAFDIGAGGGERTLALAGLVGPKGLVVSFEHDQTRADQLTANVGLNHLANVTVLRARTDAAPAPAATGHGVTLHELGQRESTRCVRVDEVVRRSLVPAPQLIVISMPGGETGVLDGLRTVLKRHRPAVLLRIEAGDYASFQRQLADVVDHLVRIGRSVRHLGATTEVGGRFVGVVAGISPPRSARHLEQLDAQALAADVDEVADQTGWRPRAANSGAR